MRTKFQLYTVPGQIYYNSTRKLVLQGVDGVIFVADSDPDKIEENIESYQNLLDNLNEHGKDAAELPHVIQYNKRDLPNAMPVHELDKAVNKYGVPTFESVANTGEGVFPTLKTLAGMVLESIDRMDQRRRPAPARSADPVVAKAPAHHAGHGSSAAEDPHHTSRGATASNSRQKRHPHPPSGRPGSGHRHAAGSRGGGPRRRPSGARRHTPRGGRPPAARGAGHPRPATPHHAGGRQHSSARHPSRLSLMTVCVVALAVAVAGVVYFAMNPGL